MSFPQHCRIHSFPSVDALCDRVVAALEVSANASIAARGAFHLVLAGGRTPQAVYARLANLTTDWHCWYVYFGDERCLPAGDAGRNDTMAFAQWLETSPIPHAQIFPMPAELGAERGAEVYSAVVAPLDRFDLTLLGLGEDGHTASLFPGHGWDGAPAIAVHDSPKPPSDRISLSASRLSASRAVWFLVTGADKAEAMQRWRHGEMLPPAMIRPTEGVDVYTDLAL